MLHADTDINQLIREHDIDPDFPHAPLGWTREDAIAAAREESLTLTDVHWEAIRAMQGYYARHADDTTLTLRELHDALDEHFHHRGGLKYLYTVFPGGPIVQISRLGGLIAPTNAIDRNFGSVA